MSTFTQVPPSIRSNLIWRLNEPNLLGSSIFAFPGETITLNIQVEGSNAPTSPTATVYKGRSDNSAINMPSGSHSVSGQVITLKPLTGLIANVAYSIMVTATIAGNIEQRKVVVECVDDKAV